MATHTRPQLTAEPRSAGAKKSELRTMRQNGLVPASLFGHGQPENIRVEARALSDHLRHHAQTGLVDLMINGRPTPALIRELERNPITGEVIALGFQRVDMRETLKTSVTIVVTGEEQLVNEGLVLNRSMEQVEVHGRADALPEAITLDVSHCQPGDTIRIGDLQLPEGVEATKDADLPVLTVSTPTIPADVAAALDAEEAAHEAERASHGTEEEAEESEEETVATA